MKKEYVLAAIFGMFLLSYLLDAVVDPPSYVLSSPYEFLNPLYYTKYPFTTASVIIRSLAVFLTPVLLLGFFISAHFAKGVVYLITSVLVQLYAVQVVATNSQVVPLEWALSLAFGGALLLVPAAISFLQGSLSSFHQGIKKSVKSEAMGGVPEWASEKEE